MSRDSDRRDRADLAAFANTLEAAGFRVYRPGGTWTFLGFAREVDGTLCVATVEASDFGNMAGWRWHMSIKPSRENGSSMFLDSVPDGTPLTVETATEVTVPHAYNQVVGRQPNVGQWPTHWHWNPRPADLVAAVTAHATEHYNDGGWDVIVECWDDQQIAEHVKGATSEADAIARFEDVVAVWADRQADVRNSAF